MRFLSLFLALQKPLMEQNTMQEIFLLQISSVTHWSNSGAVLNVYNSVILSVRTHDPLVQRLWLYH
ncbi:hypothetical protein AAFF_G00120740 [Aldrovandia affinis]|uniref:Uncharacterized protein n=1 Tax=Aldrovandia affinis TaxID=143900 RepID=A0AAD7W9Z1_9TELE|nr:hypothetical protein AAFF_G00120740 [Aldrovandia affinis]